MKNSILTFKSAYTAWGLAAALITTSCSKQGSQEESKTSPPKVESTPKQTREESKPKLEEEEQKTAITVFCSFDPQNQYNKSTSWGVVNDNKDGYRGQAEWFIPTASGQLNTVDLAMDGKGSVNITVAEDKNETPGKAVESFTNVSSSHFSGGHLVLESKAHPVINVGTKYWLCVEPAVTNNGCGWGFNNQKLAQGFAYEREQGNWSFVPDSGPNGAFRINVVP